MQPSQAKKHPGFDFTCKHFSLLPTKLRHAISETQVTQLQLTVSPGISQSSAKHCGGETTSSVYECSAELVTVSLISVLHKMKMIEQIKVITEFLLGI